MQNIDKSILRIALPSIVANITVTAAVKKTTLDNVLFNPEANEVVEFAGYMRTSDSTIDNQLGEKMELLHKLDNVNGVVWWPGKWVKRRGQRGSISLSPSMIQRTITVLLIPLLAGTTTSTEYVVKGIPSFPLRTTAALLTVPHTLTLHLIIIQILFIRFQSTKMWNLQVSDYFQMSIIHHGCSGDFPKQPDSHHDIEPDISDSCIHSAQQIGTVCYCCK